MRDVAEGRLALAAFCCLLVVVEGGKCGNPWWLYECVCVHVCVLISVHMDSVALSDFHSMISSGVFVLFS